MKLSFEHKQDYVIVNIDTEGIVEPNSLKDFENIPVEADGKKGIILNGRAPIWVYCYLAHRYHYCRWIAVNDPRIGAIVVQTHCTDKQIGDIVQF